MWITNSLRQYKRCPDLFAQVRQDARDAGHSIEIHVANYLVFFPQDKDKYQNI